mmetsp:Transcript_106770/g.300131  ORF Transcript_106770/g.300131 Transcript_106770/m.300131 type:complete len:963 (-) Transcript_106770:169-3057(-)
MSGESDHPILRTRWFARLQRNDMVGLQEDEAEELFSAVQPGCHGVIAVPDLVSAVTLACPVDMCRLLRDVLAAAEVPHQGQLNAPMFLQAMRLGSPLAVADVASRLHGKALDMGYPVTDKRHLLAYLRRRRDTLSGFRMLPVFLALVCLVFGLCARHFEQQSVYRLTEATTQEVPLAKLQGDFPYALWTFLGERSEIAELARFSSVFGGVRVRSLGTDEDETIPRVLCKHTVLDRFSLAFGGALAAEEPRLCGDAAAAAENTRWLLWPLRQGDARFLTALSDIRSWWTNNTGGSVSGLAPLSGPDSVEVRMLAHNPHLSFFVLCRFVLRVSETGVVKLSKGIAAFTSNPVWLKSNEDRVVVQTFDVVAMIIYVLIAFFRLGRTMRDMWLLGCKRGLKAQLAWWRVIDWLIVGAGVGGTVAYCTCVRLTEGLLRLTSGLAPATASASRYSTAEFESLLVDSGFSSIAEYERRLEAASEQAVLVARVSEDLHWLAVIFVAATCLQLLRTFCVNDRLNELSCAVKASAVELTKFLFLVGCAFLAFALVGHAVFGMESPLFSTLGEALSSTLFLALGLTMDAWPKDLLATGGPLGAMWLAALAATTALLLFGAAFAIVYDAYRQVRNRDAGAAVERWQSPQHLVRALCYKAERTGTRWSDSHVLQLLSSAKPGEDAVGARDLVAEFQGQIGCEFTEEERNKLEGFLGDAIARVKRPLETDGFGRSLAPSPSDAVRLCGRVDTNVLELVTLARDLEARVRHQEDERTHMQATLAEANTAMASTGLVEAGPESIEKALVPGHPRAGVKATADQKFAIQDIERVADGASLSLPPPVAESPEPEPPIDEALVASAAEAARIAVAAEVAHAEKQTITDMAQFDAIVEERLRSAAEQQAMRHRHLEESIDGLTRRLQPFFEKSADAVGSATLDPDRIAALEAKVSQISERLAPLLDMDNSIFTAPGLVPNGF